MATAHILLPLLGIPDTTNPPRIAYTAMGRPSLLFGDTVDQLLTWAFRMPDDYASALTIKWQYSMVSATANRVAVRWQVMAVAAGTNISTDSFDTLSKTSDAIIPATAGLMAEISSGLVNLDGLAAGNYVAIQFGRENGTTGTNATGDMALWAIALTYTTT